MAAGDILLFVVQGLINAQVWQNTHFYRVLDVSGAYAEGEFVQIVQAFANWYRDNVHAVADNLFTPDMTWTGVKGYNLFNEGSVGEVTWSPNMIGSATSQPLAQFNAYGFTQPSLRRRMNSGKRRIPGVVEDVVGAFGERILASDPEMNLMADAFSADIYLDWASDTKNIEVAPVIVKRVRSGDGSLEDPYEYRLPITQGEAVYYYARSWSADRYTTTQNSRKTGRGI